MIYMPGEEGQGLVEYAIILVLIALVVFIILGVLGTQLNLMFSRLSSMIPA